MAPPDTSEDEDEEGDVSPRGPPPRGPPPSRGPPRGPPGRSPPNGPPSGPPSGPTKGPPVKGPRVDAFPTSESEAEPGVELEPETEPVEETPKRRGPPSRGPPDRRGAPARGPPGRRGPPTREPAETERGEEVTFDYGPNKVIFFPNTPDSWHKITARKPTTYPRRFICLEIKTTKIRLHNYQAVKGKDTMKTFDVRYYYV